jgi:hypothetical protein
VNESDYSKLERKISFIIPIFIKYNFAKDTVSKELSIIIDLLENKMLVPVFPTNFKSDLAGCYGFNDNNLNQKITQIFGCINDFKNNDGLIIAPQNQNRLTKIIQYFSNLISQCGEETGEINCFIQKNFMAFPGLYFNLISCQQCESFLTDTGYNNEIIEFKSVYFEKYNGRCKSLSKYCVTEYPGKYRIDSMDTQTNDKKEGEKLNLPHFHIDDDYSFYLIDQFFDIEINVKNHWKHYKNNTKYNLTSEICEIITKPEFDFQVPINILI